MAGQQRMSAATPKPVFTFKGLSYLYHIEQCRVRPVGYDRQAVKYFEMVDLVENVQFFTAEVTALDEDLVMKDKYGIIRFCIHGWDTMGQLDVYVNIKKPIGIVKDLVFYDHNLVPIFSAQRTHLGRFNCFGPPTYKIKTIIVGNEVGYITPEPASIHLKFDQLLDEGAKALLVAFSLQLALAKYKFLNLSLTKVRYLYKDREKAKAKKEAKRLAELQKLKGSRLGSLEDGTAVMPVVPVAIPVAVPVPQPVASPTCSRRPTQDETEPKVIVVKVPEASPAPTSAPQVIVMADGSAGESAIPPPPTIPSPPRGSNAEGVLVKVIRRKTKPSRAGSMCNPEEQSPGDRYEMTENRQGKLSAYEKGKLSAHEKGKLSAHEKGKLSAHEKGKLSDADMSCASGPIESLRVSSRPIVKKKKSRSRMGDNQTDLEMSEIASFLSPSKCGPEPPGDVEGRSRDATRPGADGLSMKSPRRDLPSSTTIKRSRAAVEAANKSPRAKATPSPAARAL